MSAGTTNPVGGAPAVSGSERLSGSLQQATAQFKALPRALRWLFVAVLLIGFYALCRNTTWSWAAEASSRADALQAELDRANQRQLVSPPLRNVVLAVGPIRLPPAEDEGSIALADAVNEVLKRHPQVEKISDQGQAASRLQGAGLVRIMPRGAKAAKVSREIEFSAAPHVATEIIAELESHPAVDSVSRVELDAGGGRDTLKVKLTVEAWVAGDDRARRSS